MKNKVFRLILVAVVCSDDDSRVVIEPGFLQITEILTENLEISAGGIRLRSGRIILRFRIHITARMRAEEVVEAEGRCAILINRHLLLQKPLIKLKVIVGEGEISLRKGLHHTAVYGVRRIIEKRFQQIRHITIAAEVNHRLEQIRHRENIQCFTVVGRDIIHHGIGIPVNIIERSVKADIRAVPVHVRQECSVFIRLTDKLFGRKIKITFFPCQQEGKGRKGPAVFGRHVPIIGEAGEFSKDVRIGCEGALHIFPVTVIQDKVQHVLFGGEDKFPLRREIAVFIQIFFRQCKPD